ncbi:MAG: rod-binding protein [Clostridiales bacterium]|jgi:flagellar protein FlgJ|nr:rod-binding protein [Clostridiales bacterium]
MEVNGLGSLAFTNYANDLYINEETNFKQKLEAAKKLEDDNGLKEACTEMESYFINYLFKVMRGTVNREGSFIKPSMATETYEDMMYEEVSKVYARAGGIGLSGMLYKQMSAELAAVDLKA